MMTEPVWLFYNIIEKPQTQIMSYDQMFIFIPMDRSTDIISISKQSFILRET